MNIVKSTARVNGRESLFTRPENLEKIREFDVGQGKIGKVRENVVCL